MTRDEKGRLDVLEEKINNINENVVEIKKLTKERLDEHALRIHQLELHDARGSMWQVIGNRILWVVAGAIGVGILGLI